MYNSTLSAPSVCGQIALFILLPLAGLSQPHWVQNDQQDDRMQALRIAYFVEELALTAEESTLFWPAWNEEQAKLRAHGDAMRSVEDQLRNAQDDQAAERLISEMKTMRLEAVELQHAAIAKMAEFIGFKRAGMIKQIEREFRATVMKRRMNDRGPGGSGQRPGGPPRH